MKKTSPAISVIMPVYNSEKFLPTSIESILGQTFRDFEFIIFDDGSTDSSWDVITSYAKRDERIKARKNKNNVGVSKALNSALKETRGKYIARMDADDWSYPYRFEEQFRFMEQHPEVAVSGGLIKLCDELLKTINLRKYPLTDSKIRKIIFKYSPFAHPATIWNTNKIKKVGGYNENIPVGQDYELYFRIGLVGKFANLNRVLLKLRVHEKASSMLKGRAQEHYTLYARIKGFLEYRYHMSRFDKVYTFLQLISSMIIPVKVKFWMFNMIRKYT